MTEQDSRTDRPTNIVVVQADGREFGLVVDEITDTEEIVVKPMGKQLKGISAYSGATIMGDGRVALILDILGLAQRAQVISEARESALSDKEKANKRRGATFRSPNSARGAMRRPGPDGDSSFAGGAARRIPRRSSRDGGRAGSHAVSRTDYAADPALHMYLPPQEKESSAAAEGRLQVVVYSEAGRSVGLVVDRIVDIVEESLVVQNPAERKGVIGSSVIQKRVTDLLDVPRVVRDVIPGFRRTAGKQSRRGDMGASQQFCTFLLDGHVFGTPVPKVQEVIQHQEMTRVPLAPDVVSGLINLRGQIVSAIDLRRRLGLPDRPQGQLPMNVVVRTNDGAVSLLVDEIGDVIEVEEETLESPPETLQGFAREVVQRRLQAFRTAAAGARYR